MTNNAQGSNKDRNGAKGRNAKGSPRGNKNRSSASQASVKNSPSVIRGSAGSSGFNNIRTNDISWYNKVEPLFSDATRVPFNRIAGDILQLNNEAVTNGSDGEGCGSYSNGGSAPGIMGIHYMPTIGKASSSDDPVNRAFTSMYGDIYSRTTGAMQFQQADLAMWVLGMDSIISCIGLAKRLLGVANVYVAQNFNYPRFIYAALVGAMPTEAAWTTFIGSQDEYRRRLNNAILSFNSMNVPDFIDLFKRHYTLSSNIWADNESVQAQLYAFLPLAYYRYIDTESQLVATPWPQKQMTMENILVALETMLQLWRNSSDLGLIKGSVERAYADSSFVKLDYVDVDNVTIPVFDRVMLYQINNATISPKPILPDLNGFSGYEQWNITQNPEKNLILSSPNASVAAASAGENRAIAYYGKLYGPDTLRILNSYDGNIDAEFIMEATRLMTVFGSASVGPNGINVSINQCGTEVVSHLECWYKNAISAQRKQLPPIEGTALWSPVNAIPFFETDALISKFDMAPRLPRMLWDSTNSRYIGEIGDLNVFTTVDASTMQGLNIAALQSIYTVNTTKFMK